MYSKPKTTSSKKPTECTKKANPTYIIGCHG